MQQTPGVIEVIGCYPVVEAREPCHLLELVVTNSPGFDIGSITQDDPTQPRENWQAPYDERLLTAEGDADQEASLRPEALRGDLRLAFFMHYLDPSRLLTTPLGDVPPRATVRPERLGWLGYEEP
jgi:hypothetical protein